MPWLPAEFVQPVQRSGRADRDGAGVGLGGRYEHDLADLERHAREIEKHESFNYGLLGCVYIAPQVRQGADAEISWWVMDDFVTDWITGSCAIDRPSMIGIVWQPCQSASALPLTRSLRRARS